MCEGTLHNLNLSAIPDIAFGKACLYGFIYVCAESLVSGLLLLAKIHRFSVAIPWAFILWLQFVYTSLDFRSNRESTPYTRSPPSWQAKLETGKIFFFFLSLSLLLSLTFSVSLSSSFARANPGILPDVEQRSWSGLLNPVPYNHTFKEILPLLLFSRCTRRFNFNICKFFRIMSLQFSHRIHSLFLVNCIVGKIMNTFTVAAKKKKKLRDISQK